MKIYSYFSSLNKITSSSKTKMFDYFQTNTFTRLIARNRLYILKLFGIGAIASMTIRFLYQDTLAYEKSRLNKSGEIINQNEKLVSVLMITRHGARTPLHVISKLEEVEYSPDLLEPYVKAKFKLKHLDNTDFNDLLSYYDQINMEYKLKGGIGRGQLTRVGEEQMFNLGRRVRDRYINELEFLSSNYNPEQFYTRSTHYRRTINSAKSVLAGVFLDSAKTVPNEPFIINIQHLHEDCLFPNPINCSYYAEMHKFIRSLSLYTSNKEYMENLMHLNQILSVNDSKENKSYSFTQFRDDMLARQVHGLHVPKSLEEFVLKSDRYAAMELTAETEHNVKISCGRLLDLFKDNLLSSFKNDMRNQDVDFHKFRYYSAHDSTLNAILVAFDLIDENHRWPPFAADITIELWKYTDKKSDYFIKIFYCGQSVKLPICIGERCGFNEFIELLEKNAVDKHGYDKLCNKKFLS